MHNITPFLLILQIRQSTVPIMWHHNKIKTKTYHCVKITKSNNSPDDTTKYSIRSSLVVVIWLIDDACDGFAFDSDANQHCDMIK